MGSWTKPKGKVYDSANPYNVVFVDSILRHSMFKESSIFLNMISVKLPVSISTLLILAKRIC